VGDAGEQHRHDAGEENAVEGPGTADRRHWRAEPAHGVEIEEIGADQRAKAAAGIGERRGVLAREQQRDQRGRDWRNARTTRNADREQGGLQANVVIDRIAASRLGVKVQDIDNALNNSFSQRQISTIFTQRNQYRVILEVDPQHRRDPSDIDHVYIAGAGGTQVPLSAV
jgi:multidrug efflux pump subunit AcrB